MLYLTTFEHLALPTVYFVWEYDLYKQLLISSLKSSNWTRSDKFTMKVLYSFYLWTEEILQAMFLLISKCQPSSLLLAVMKLYVSVCSVLTVWPKTEISEIHSPNALTMPARHDDSETNCGNGALLGLGKGRRRAHSIQPVGQSKDCSRNPANKEKSSLLGGTACLLLSVPWNLACRAAALLPPS